MSGKPRVIVVGSGAASPLDFTSHSAGVALGHALTVEVFVVSAAITGNDSGPM